MKGFKTAQESPWHLHSQSQRSSCINLALENSTRSHLGATLGIFLIIPPPTYLFSPTNTFVSTWRQRNRGVVKGEMLSVLQQGKSIKSSDRNAPNINRALGRINRPDLQAIRNSWLNKRLISKTQRYLKASISKEDGSWLELKHSSCSVHLSEHFKSPKIEL